MSKRHANEIGNLESLFLRLEELVLANSGEDEFEEIFKLLVAKLRDEKSGKQKRFYTYSDAQETYAQVSSLLLEAERTWPGVLPFGVKLHLSPDHLNVCVEALSQHQILDKDLTVLDSFFEFLTARTAKGAKGQYFTPRHVVELCVRMLRPTYKDTILDPACGSAGFLMSALNYVQAQGDLTTPEAFQEYCRGKLWGCDIDARAVQVARTLMVLAGATGTNIFQLNSLLLPTPASLFSSLDNHGTEASDASVLTIEDVCRARLRHHKGFDFIVTNPPFAGEIKERQLLDQYTLTKGKESIERDVLFLERCIQLLRPGGQLAVILPNNKFSAKSWGYLREWLFRKARILAVVSLGRNTFLPHTHQKASILLCQKQPTGQDTAQDQRIFFAISEHDGKDATGQLQVNQDVPDGASHWLRIHHDFNEIVASYHAFLKSETV